MLFPYNDMFSHDVPFTTSQKIYLVKHNDNRIPITQFPYWKKDFLEQAPLKFSIYLRNKERNQVEGILSRKIKDSALLVKLTKRLSPLQNQQNRWLEWYVTYAGIQLKHDDKIELMKYDVSFTKETPIIDDSVTICKTTHNKHD